MNNKFKLILIAVELFALLVLLLLGVGCQQKWIVVTGNGPRFDWYALIETQPPKKDIPEIPSDPITNEPDETTEPIITEPITTVPPPTSAPQTVPPETIAPEESTVPEENTTPEESTTPEEPTNSSGTREDELPRIPAT